MPPKDAHHDVVHQALVKDGWEITNDPYVISYGERFLFIDLGATESETEIPKGNLVGAKKGGERIAIEIKQFHGKSAIADLEQAIGQYILYRLLLEKVDPGREIYLAVSQVVFDELFSEPIGELVINELPLQLLIINIPEAKVHRWIPQRPTER